MKKKTGVMRTTVGGTLLRFRFVIAVKYIS